MKTKNLTTFNSFTTLVTVVMLKKKTIFKDWSGYQASMLWVLFPGRSWIWGGAQASPGSHMMRSQASPAPSSSLATPASFKAVRSCQGTWAPHEASGRTVWGPVRPLLPWGLPVAALPTPRGGNMWTSQEEGRDCENQTKLAHSLNVMTRKWPPWSFNTTLTLVHKIFSGDMRSPGGLTSGVSSQPALGQQLCAERATPHRLVCASWCSPVPPSSDGHRRPGSSQPGCGVDLNRHWSGVATPKLVHQLNGQDVHPLAGGQAFSPATRCEQRSLLPQIDAYGDNFMAVTGTTLAWGWHVDGRTETMDSTCVLDLEALVGPANCPAGLLSLDLPLHEVMFIIRA